VWLLCVIICVYFDILAQHIEEQYFKIIVENILNEIGDVESGTLVNMVSDDGNR
jgi:hypothetical protein